MKKNKYFVIDKSYTIQFGFNTWLNMRQQQQIEKKRKKAKIR